MAFVGNVVRILGVSVFSVYCCDCLHLGCTRYWLSTFNKLQSVFHVYHFFLISLMPYFFLYLFTSSRVSRVHHPALESLRTHIPAVLVHSKAPSTFKTYHGFKRWKSWASGFPEVILLPGSRGARSLVFNFVSSIRVFIFLHSAGVLQYKLFS